MNVTLQNVALLARREFFALFGTAYARAAPTPIGFAIASTPSSFPVPDGSPVLGPVVDFGAASFVQVGRSAILTISGLVQGSAASTCPSIEIALQSPDGVPVIRKLVPISIVNTSFSGFQAVFELYHPAVTKYWVYFQCFGATGSPTLEVTEVKLGYIQMPSDVNDTLIFF